MGSDGFRKVQRKERWFRGAEYQSRRCVQMAEQGGGGFEQQEVGERGKARKQPAQIDYQGIVSDQAPIPTPRIPDSCYCLMKKNHCCVGHMA